jgi:hypothetical protein
MKDFRKIFREAKEANNVYLMNEIFDELANEVGIIDNERDQAQSSIAKEAAERKNARDRADGGKKL